MTPAPESATAVAEDPQPAPAWAVGTFRETAPAPEAGSGMDTAPARHRRHRATCPALETLTPEFPIGPLVRGS
ncbi:hypothetical protein GCM10027073_69590 [Streptomyces chlorus]